MTWQEVNTMSPDDQDIDQQYHRGCHGQESAQIFVDANVHVFGGNYCQL